MLMRTAVVCIGNALRGDDGIGPLVAANLKKALSEKVIGKDCDTLVLDTGTAPENFISVISRFCPGMVFIVDAVSMNEKPGTIADVPAKDAAGMLFSTHKLPVGLFMKFLSSAHGINARFIGIQAADTSFGSKMCSECKESAKLVTGMLLALLTRVKISEK